MITAFRSASFLARGLSSSSIGERIESFKKAAPTDQVTRIFLAVGKELLGGKQPAAQNYNQIVEELQSAGHLQFPSEMEGRHPNYLSFLLRAVSEMSVPIEKKRELLFDSSEERLHAQEFYSYPFKQEDSLTPGLQDRALFRQLLREHPLFSDKKKLLLFPGCSNLGPMIEASTAGFEAVGFDVSEDQMRIGFATALALGVNRKSLSLFLANALHPELDIRKDFGLGDREIVVISLLPPVLSTSQIVSHVGIIRKGLSPRDRLALFSLRLAEKESDYLKAQRLETARWGERPLEDRRGRSFITGWPHEGGVAASQAFQSDHFLRILAAGKGTEAIKAGENSTHSCHIFTPNFP